MSRGGGSAWRPDLCAARAEADPWPQLLAQLPPVELVRVSEDLDLEHELDRCGCGRVALLGIYLPSSDVRVVTCVVTRVHGETLLPEVVHLAPPLPLGHLDRVAVARLVPVPEDRLGRPKPNQSQRRRGRGRGRRRLRWRLPRAAAAVAPAAVAGRLVARSPPERGERPGVARRAPRRRSAKARALPRVPGHF